MLERIESRILFIRGQKVMLDTDLAVLYGVEVRALNQAVARNLGRFPPDFMFRLSPEEAANLKSQTVISSLAAATSSAGHGGRRHPPCAFTEQGVAMLSSVLRSRRAILVNVEIMRAFVRLRRILASNAELARRLNELEQKYDAQFRVVFDAIRALMTPPALPERHPVGFTPPGRD
ncbi:MAG: ORF6N domain-containing protein [Armatimonadetes bacterium]|nr:ORF6N domain-containing protein [Armatimonadota bacterium]